MTNGVRDDLLHGAQRRFGDCGILDGDVVRFDFDGRCGDDLAQRAERRREIDRLVLAKAADDVAHIAEEQLRQRLTLLDVLLRRSFREMTGHFEIETEGR